MASASSDEAEVGDGAEACIPAGGPTVKVGYHWRHRPEAPPVLVREIRSQGLSFQLWPAAGALCWLLEEHFGRECGKEGALEEEERGVERLGVGSGKGLELLGRSLVGKRVLEVGSGTGLVGILCAQLGAHVTLTDLPKVCSSLMENVRVNISGEDDVSSKVDGPEMGEGWESDDGEGWKEERVLLDGGGSVDVRPLRWGEEADVSGLLDGYDLIVGSDVVYYEELFEPLIQTLCRVTNVGGLQNGTGCGDDKDLQTRAESANEEAPGEDAAKQTRAPLILLSHLRRWKKDARFFKLARKFFEVHLVHSHPPEGQNRKGVEIFLLIPKHSTSETQGGGRNRVDV